MLHQTADPAPTGKGYRAGSLEFDDFDAIREVAPDWDQRHLQIGRGRGSVKITLAQSGSMLLSDLFRAPGILTQGAPPPGKTLLVVKLDAGVHTAQRLPWDRSSLGVIPRGQDFELVATGPTRVFTVCVDHQRLDAEAMARWGVPFPVEHSGPCLRFRRSESWSALVSTWTTWLDAMVRRPEFLDDPGVVARMEAQVLGAALDNVAPTAQVPPSRPRRELALRAESFIRRSLEESITLEDICRATHASARAIHSSFQSSFGTSPKLYWKALRLSHARQDLTHPTRRLTVSEVAAKWGFFRFGYFAADYRQMFGENPSQTLHRALGRVLHRA